ncbi:MAG: DUF4376 domain-containing protein [Phenylobacterium sp.]|uniref:DUF4376 domain-containing protein n=1 Tax=Phenylobacterium sp. TaxID=1871053 RepID=UPI00391970C7
MAFAIIINGVATELVPGESFWGAPFVGEPRTHWTAGEDGVLVEHEIAGEVQRNRYPAEALISWTDQARASIGVFPIAEPGPVPAGKRVVSTSIAIENGQPVRQRVLEDIPIAELAEAKMAAVRDKRWQVETAGVEVAGTPVRTDERSQGKISGALQLFDLNPALEAVDWEAQPGLFVEISKPALQAVALAVGGHIQACFTRSKDLTLEIVAARDANDRAALLAVDIEAGWPQ